MFLSRTSSIILHCSVNPCFWEGVDVACQIVLLSSYITLSFHTTRKNYSTLMHSFGRRLILYIFFLSRISSIILHCSINPCFWEGVDVACQTFNLSSCIALSPILLEQMLYPYWLLREGIDFMSVHIYIHFFQEFLLSSYMSLPAHTFRKCHSTTHSFLKGLGSLYLSVVSFIILHCPIHPCFWEGVRLHAKLFFYHPAWPCHSILLGKILKNSSTLIHSFGRGLILYIYI